MLPHRLSASPEPDEEVKPEPGAWSLGPGPLTCIDDQGIQDKGVAVGLYLASGSWVRGNPSNGLRSSTRSCIHDRGILLMARLVYQIRSLDLRLAAYRAVNRRLTVRCTAGCMMVGTRCSCKILPDQFHMLQRTSHCSSLARLKLFVNWLKTGMMGLLGNWGLPRGCFVAPLCGVEGRQRVKVLAAWSPFR
ncbi:hypothetical protein VTI74DRAFT_9968 [Chaetomium olivicolor]